MVETTTRMTADELLRLRDDGRRYELVCGVLRVGEPPGARHGAEAGRITILLGQHVLAERLGIVFGETGFVLNRDPDTVRAPDVAFVTRERIPPGELSPKYFEGPPDLAVEVLSPDDTAYEIEEKVDEYLVAGTRAVWVVNPKLRRVTVHEPGAAPRVLREGDTLDGGALLPGFRCQVQEIFEWV